MTVARIVVEGSLHCRISPSGCLHRLCDCMVFAVVHWCFLVLSPLLVLPWLSSLRRLIVMASWFFLLKEPALLWAVVLCFLQLFLFWFLTGCLIIDNNIEDQIVEYNCQQTLGEIFMIFMRMKYKNKDMIFTLLLVIKEELHNNFTLGATHI